MLTESPALSLEQSWQAVNARENITLLQQGMLGLSVCLLNAAQAPARGLSGAVVSARMLAWPPANTEVLPSARQSRGWRCLLGRAAGTEPGAGWGEQPGSEGGCGQAAGTLRCQGRAGCRLSGGQQRTGITRGISSSVWLPLVFVGGLSCLVPSLGRCWHWHKLLALPPPCHLCVRVLILSPRQCFKDEPFQNAWGSQHHFLPRLLPPYLGVSTLPWGPLHPLGRWSSILSPEHVTSPGCPWPPQADPLKEG